MSRWRPHLIVDRGYLRVYYRRIDDDGHVWDTRRPRAYTADLVPFKQRQQITGPAIEFATAWNARRHSG